MTQQTPESSPDRQPIATDIVDQALESLRHEAVPTGPSPELISATHQALWYPFQSPEVRDICRHMTPEETRQLTVYARKVGWIVGIVPSLILYPLFGYLALCTPLYPPRPWSIFVLLVLVVPVTFLIGWLGISGFRRKQIQMLCQTDYAKLKGFTPRTLPLYAFGRNKSHRLIIAVLIAAGLVPLSLLIGLGPVIPSVGQFLQSQRDDFQSRMVLYRMSKVYANCKSYQDTGVAKTVIQRDGREQVQEIPFTTAFVRHDRLRYEFQHQSGSQRYYRYIIWSDGKSVQSWWDVAPGIKTTQSLNVALGGAPGAGGAGTIPAFLLPWRVTPNLAATITDTKQLADEQLNGIECIQITGKYAANPITLWIDRQTYLIRQIHLRMTTAEFTSEQTTIYMPTIDEVVPERMLEFAPPSK